MIARNQRRNRIASWQDTELEPGFGFSSQSTELVPKFPENRIASKASLPSQGQELKEQTARVQRI
jgi:hypothetical protein